MVEKDLEMECVRLNGIVHRMDVESGIWKLLIFNSRQESACGTGYFWIRKLMGLLGFPIAVLVLRIELKLQVKTYRIEESSKSKSKIGRYVRILLEILLEALC